MLLLAPAVLGGARSIHYTTRLEIATDVQRALARCHFSKSHHRPACVAAIGPYRSRTAQRRRACEALAAMPWPPAVSQPHDFLEIGNFAQFFEFLHIKGRHFPDFFPFKSTPMNHEKFHGNRSTRFFKIRNTDTQTDRCGNFIYIYRSTFFATFR